MRRAKIVATLGPALDDPAVLEAVLRAGVDVARVNFSHGTEESHLARVAQLRAAADRAGRVVAVLGDLPGPKLRVKIPAARDLKAGDRVTFSLTHDPRHPDDVTITEPEVLGDVKPGQRLLLDDGRLQLRAEETKDGRLVTTVAVGGTLHPNKGLNLPETDLTIAAVTDRDRAAIAVAARAGVDWLALSFVRGPEAAEELRHAATEVGLRVPVLAKLERPEAVRRAASIVAAFDGVMVARGDLGVEMPLEQVPTIQKQLIAEARAAGKPVITATDMLDSMRNNPRPTRAEASDVANAIYDGTDAVMLSGETAVGSYPVESVRCMARIVEETELHLRDSGRSTPAPVFHRPGEEIDEAIASAACRLADEVGATALLTPTLTGRTPRLLARHRPRPLIVAPAPTPAVLRSMAVVWGLTPVAMAPLAAGSDRLAAAVRDAFAAGVVRPGDRVVVLAGHPTEGGLRFPTVRVVRVGEEGTALEP